MIFVDTSALYALLDADDSGHATVAGAWPALRGSKPVLVTTNYVMCESIALVQSRVGLRGVQQLTGEFVPLLHVEWVDPEVHELALRTMLAANRRDLSLVDCTSFLIMRRLGINQAFTLDAHFRDQGFDCIPPPQG